GKGNSKKEERSLRCASAKGADAPVEMTGGGGARGKESQNRFHELRVCRKPSYGWPARQHCKKMDVEAECVALLKST
ncbi:MAG TPA: hypothetical protein VJO16_02320, partial [Candidatus Acidoferrum sp.]|nr:hypothetical protein [Candidatus Acidoferrum sp.]